VLQVEVMVMAEKSLRARVKKVRELVDSLGPAVAFRKLRGVLGALEMQVEDGNYQRHAVARLCEALLATAELYYIPEELAQRLEEAACSVVSLVEDRR
jgi:hypothetical protein